MKPILSLLIMSFSLLSPPILADAYQDNSLKLDSDRLAEDRTALETDIQSQLDKGLFSAKDRAILSDKAQQEDEVFKSQADQLFRGKAPKASNQALDQALFQDSGQSKSYLTQKVQPKQAIFGSLTVPFYGGFCAFLVLGASLITYRLKQEESHD